MSPTKCCGKLVEVGSILHVRCVLAWGRGQWWNDLEVYLMADGVDTCKVGYLSKDFCGEADYLDNKYIRVNATSVLLKLNACDIFGNFSFNI